MPADDAGDTVHVVGLATSHSLLQRTLVGEKSGDSRFSPDGNPLSATSIFEALTGSAGT